MVRCAAVFIIYLEQVQPFCGLAEAILQMDAMMDALDCPQTSAEHRSFQLPNRELKNDMAAPAGSLFISELASRGNAGHRSERVAFRSVLELLHLLCSALEGK